MTQFRNLFCIFFFCCYSTLSLAQYIQVNDTYTAQQLVENVLINSPCANVSNFTVSGDTFSPGEQSYGYFTGGSSSFPFTSGIVLSTSRAKRTEGPNNNLIDEGDTNWLGDSDLEQALNISNTFNATVLEFDFTPLTSKISFDYIFASEEYQGSAPCRYSDGFAFLLKEANTTNSYQNLALIPNTTTPVLVTTVHPDISGNCAAINASYFGGFNGSNAPINLNGQTVVLTAKSAVVPGRTYHIKLVIADHENIRYDSAIFLGGGSFNVGTDLGPDRLIATNNPVCDGKTYTLDATEVGTNSYKWYRNNLLIAGATNPTYTVTSAGIYKVEVTLGTTTCIAIGEVTIEYTPLPALTNTTIVQCDDDNNGITLFNLTKVDNIIKNNDPTFGVVHYYENLIDAQNEVVANAIANPASYQSIPKTIYATASNVYGCSNSATVTLQISNNSVPSSRDFESCDLDGNKDGYYGFQMSAIDGLLLTGLPTGLVVEYYPTVTDALLGTNILPAIYTNTVRYQITIYAKIVNGPDCYGIIPLRLFVNKNEPDNFEDEAVHLCNGNPETISVAPTFSSYLWSNGATTFSTQITTPGDYTVTVSDSNTCEATKKFIASYSEKPTILSVDVNDFQGTENTVTITVSGIGNYEYSLDGIHFQDSPIFYNVLMGEYHIQVKDKNKCGDDFYTIYVLNYPSYFTPNNDGYNDLWFIPNLETHPYAVVSIFDRYGKFIYQFSRTEKGWDGTLNSKKLPSDDYWFVLNLENNKTVKGHFSLKR
jgi:gliding motility-associated-like protein